jgi:hypothetical protein
MSSNLFSGSATSTAKTTGVVPGNEPALRNEGDIKRIWYLSQIYDPDIHPVSDMAKYIIPLEGELVVDVDDNRFLIVKHVDKYNTWKSTFENYFLLPEKDVSDYDLFPQHEYGFLQGELALAIDFSTRPAVARVDANAVAPNAAYAMLYKGAIISEKGEIISATYANMDLVNNQIGVSPVVYDNLENNVVMGCNSFSVTQNEAALPNGTRCTLVYYDQAGRPIPPTYPVVVQHCAYLRDHQLDKKYITSIELLAPWFTNSTKPNTLFIPVNLPLSAVEFRALVHYSDGTTSEQPVNSFNGDNGFRLDGINQYKPTTPGQISDAVVLTYFFSESEQASIAQPGAPRHMSNLYEIVATPAQGAYSPRIYTYPYWDSAAGYKLKHWLTDLDRKYCRDVTDKVTLNETSPVFQGQLFGQEQPMVFNLNMRDVSAIYEPWAFIQYSTITLFNPPSAPGRKWNVRHDYNAPGFPNMVVEFWQQVGGGNPGRFATVTTIDEFLDAGYWAFAPMYDVRTEVKAPTPTHFDLVREDGTFTSGIPVAAFNQLPISSIALSTGTTLYIRWVLRESDGNELQLGVSAAICNEITAPTT